ncbi:MAG: hypothetical protein R3F56_05155 [Planctomycetota bacterium]
MLGLTAQVVLLVVALRHHLVWGAGRNFAGIELRVLLGVGEGIGLLAFTVFGALALRGALAETERVDEATAATWTRSLLRAGILLATVAALVPPFLSSDVFDYIARGRVEAHYGANPYVTPPSSLAADDDPVLSLAQWPQFVMPYGPLSALAQALCAWLGGAVPWLGVLFFKILTATAHVATGWLLGRAAPPREAPRVLALWLFHPWILLESCGSAHNEALVCLALAWMLERAARDRWLAATLAFGLAVLTKHGCAPLGPLLLVAAWRRQRLVPFAGGVAVTAGLTLILAWRYFLKPGALDFLATQTGNRGTSLQHFAVLVTDPSAAPWLLWGGYAATLATLAWAAARTRALEDFARRGVDVMVVFVVLAMPLFSPWYHLWWAPLCARIAARDGPTVALRALAWLGPLSYGVYACTRQLDLGHQVWAWTLACAAPALLALRPRPGR